MSKNLRKEIEEELNGLKNNLEKFSSAVDIFDEAKALANQASHQIQKSFADNKKIFDKTGDELQKLIGKQQEYTDHLQETLSKLSDLQSKISESDIPEELEKLNKQITDFKEKVNSDFDSVVKDFDKAKSHLDKKIEEHSDGISKEITGLKSEIKKGFEDSKKEMLVKIESYHKSNQTEIKGWFKKSNQDLKEHSTTNYSKVDQKLTDSNKKLIILLSVIILLQIVLIVSLFL